MGDSLRRAVEQLVTRRVVIPNVEIESQKSQNNDPYAGLEEIVSYGVDDLENRFPTFFTNENENEILPWQDDSLMTREEPKKKRKPRSKRDFGPPNVTTRSRSNK